MSFPGIIYFFDEHVKPKILRGTRILHPSDTGIYDFGVKAIRQGDVNIWFYTKGDVTIAIDTGHLNWKNTDEAFEKIGVDQKSIRHVLLTHSDVDHCGGIDIKSKNPLFVNAKAYLGRGEIPYLERKLHRQTKLGFIKIYNCVQLKKDIIFLDDEQTLDLDGIKVRCIEVPGHTKGHMCYLVDDHVLFSGDCIAMNDEGGYSFWNFFSQFPQMNMESLAKLKKKLENVKLDCLCTGHSGFRTDVDRMFLHMNEPALFDRKIPFDENAPSDVFAD